MTVRRLIATLLFTGFFISGLISPQALGQQTINMDVRVQPPGSSELPTARIEVRLAFNNLSGTPEVTLNNATSQMGRFTVPQKFGTNTNTGLDDGRIQFVKLKNKDVGIVKVMVKACPDCPLSSKCSRNKNIFTSGIDYKMDLKLPQGVSINSYNLTSYRALSGSACNVVELRNTNRNPGASWKQTPSFGTAEKDRRPLNVALVLDKSGSMRKPASSQGSKSKMKVMQEAAKQFVDNWRALNMTTVDPKAQEDDSLGVVFFETNVDPVKDGQGRVFVRRTGASSNSSQHPWNHFNGKIGGRGWGGDTAMGDGMREAFKGLDALDKMYPGVQDRAMLLLTDGKQNHGNEVHKCSYFSGSACGSGSGTSNVYALKEYNSSSISTLPKRKTVIQTVFIGPPGSKPAEVMGGIAAQNGGKLQNQQTNEPLRYDPSQAGGSNPNYGFLNSLTDLLKGFSPDVVLEEGGNISVDTTAHRFYVTRTATDVNLTADWLNVDRRQALEVVLFDDDGNVVEPDIQLQRRGYTVLSADPGDYAAGQWTALVSPPSEAEEVSYYLTAMAEDPSFSSELYLPGTDHHTGEDINLQLQLTHDGEPITGVNGIQASVFGPDEGLGTILHRREAAKQQADLEEEVDQYTQKLYSLYEEQRVRDQISPNLRDTVKLVDTGQVESGDAAADDGIYSARLTNITTPGTYRFVVPLDFETEELGRIRRTKTIETTVEVRPTLEASEYSVGEGENTYLELIPKDPFGNYKGPGYIPQIQVSTAEGEPLDVRITDHQNRGIYRIEFPQLSPDSEQPLQISVGGYEFERTSLANLSGDGFTLPEITLFVIGGLLVFGLFVYLYRRRQA